MKVMYKSECGRFQAEFEGTEAEIFKQIGNFQEVFENNYCVGPDGKKYGNIRFVVRTVDGDEYYEKVCMEPGPAMYRKLAMSQHKAPKMGSLYPNRRFGKKHAKAGEIIGWSGWGKWNKETQEVE